MFTVITGLIYEDQSMTEMTANKEQRKDNDKRGCDVHMAQGMTVMTWGVKFTGHEAWQWWHDLWSSQGTRLNHDMHQWTLNVTYSECSMWVMKNVWTSSPWFTTDLMCQLDVLGHDGDLLCMDGHQIHILKQSHKVGFSCLLQCSHCSDLKVKITLEVSVDFLNQVTKWSMADH